MSFDQSYALSKKERDIFRGMDARTVARIAGLKTGTLNAWVQRGLIPGLTIGISGKRRDIDENLATRIAVFAGMVRLGIDPSDAASVAWNVHFPLTSGYLFFFPPEYEGPTDGIKPIVHFESQGELVEALYGHEWRPPRPALYGIIDLDELARRVRQAESDWQKSRGLKPDG